ncbi:hydroxymethylglutaryl-CoA lyase [Mobilicoccus pelagius]|uniref:Hydroxymethylglutaryl-CoA lyase n=1 Tax=Mobilicoccus pelagius NBRC 104925 TaxID=1089455 RepID=H5UTA3_9MICO|nr:hydroxymethylglutaryl-CoA lyase [Mobilicoccus pelagius]GAB48961.1 hydroxymethylglutaryl-CoA lyase [Mobilicoccus pelagius NBRC 104925]
MRSPQVRPAEGLPSRVTIYEVGVRDGLQNEKTIVPLDVKAEFVRHLEDAGVGVIETTSFVSPKWVPQLADAADLLAELGESGRVRTRPVLVPNPKGLDRAIEAGVSSIAVFGSATETFAARNLNNTLDGQFDMFGPVVERAKAEGMWVRCYVSMCFGDPWEGDVAPEQVVSVARRLMDLGCDELSIGDTIGVGTPGQVEAVLDGLLGAGIDLDRIAVHFHDTYGQALSNTLASLRKGVSIVDSSAGGLGGCPYAKSATGNLATEDLVWMLHGLGIETGIDLEKLVETSMWMAERLGRPSSSAVVRALGARG